MAADPTSKQENPTVRAAAVTGGFSLQTAILTGAFALIAALITAGGTLFGLKISERIADTQVNQQRFEQESKNSEFSAQSVADQTKLFSQTIGSSLSDLKNQKLAVVSFFDVYVVTQIPTDHELRLREKNISRRASWLRREQRCKAGPIRACTHRSGD
jgi:hypothetical protein